MNGPEGLDGSIHGGVVLGLGDAAEDPAPQQLSSACLESYLSFRTVGPAAIESGGSSPSPAGGVRRRHGADPGGAEAAPDLDGVSAGGGRRHRGGGGSTAENAAAVWAEGSKARATAYGPGNPAASTS